jgi:hypothetical protein
MQGRGGGRVIWVFVAIGLGVLRFALSGSHHSTYYPPPQISIPSLPTFDPSLFNPSTRPAASTSRDDDAPARTTTVGDDDRGLPLALVAEPMAGGKRLRLSAGGGSAILEMSDVQRSGSPFAFGKARLIPGERGQGEKFVAAVAKWLKVKLPAGRAGTLEPFPLSFVRLGDDDQWQANKLFFEVGSQYAEVYLNVATDGSVAKLSEKDEEYRKDLVALLARALRDGSPPRRTPENDATLASAQPLYGEPRAVPGSDYVTTGAWVKSSYVAARESLGRSTVLVWSDLAAMPRELATLDGKVAGISPSPSGDRVALSVVHPKMRGSWSTDDPGSIYVVALASGEPHELVKTSDEFHFYGGSPVVWSPDETQVALDGSPTTGKPPRPLATRVFDARSGAQVAVTDGKLGAAPVSWSADGLLLRATHYDKSFKSSSTFYTWKPGEAPRKTGAPEQRSLDGSYHFAVAGGALDVRGPAGTARYTPAAAERDALAGLRSEPRFLGGHAVLLVGEEPMALDLSSCKVRYLLGKRGPRFDSASPDGAMLLARQDDQLVFARAQ